MTWNPSYSPVILHMKSLASDHVSTIHPEKYLNTFWYRTAYGLAPCSHDSLSFLQIWDYTYLVRSSNYRSRCDADIKRGRRLDATFNYASSKLSKNLKTG